jgi:aspartate kinase
VPTQLTDRPAVSALVRKYGGTSVADGECLRRVARSVGLAHRTGRPIVVVVSAQGGTTDDLLRRAVATGERRGASREVDQLLSTGETASAALLAIALQQAGVPAESFTGGQAGIIAHGPPGAGIVAEVVPTRIHRCLAAGGVPVVAGFQGVDAAGDVLTLGRGGSDTTAVALAVALGAGECEIWTDVDGVYSSDPRIVPTARLLAAVDIEVMVELAFAGARVLHSRAVELASARQIGLRVRSAFSAAPGTVIAGRSDRSVLERWGIVAVTHDHDVVRVLVRSAGARRDLAADLLLVLADQHVGADLVARSGPFEDEFRMGFTIRRGEVELVVPALRSAVSTLDGTVVLDEQVGKVSIVGTGLLNRPEHTARMLGTLASAGIPTSWVSVSQLRTSVLVPSQQLLTAVTLLHRAFELDEATLVESVANV